MLQEITRENIGQIKNTVFRGYASMYLDIYDRFVNDVEQYGLPFHRSPDYEEETARLLKELGQQETPHAGTVCGGETASAHPDEGQKDAGSPVIFRNCGASLVYNRISPACEACKRGVGTMTSYISFRCHRSCFFCFNPNQDNYEMHCRQEKDWRGDLAAVKREGGQLTHIALTGGEPLLHADEAVEFFRLAGELFPQAHRRLYTSGDLLTESVLERLRAAGLDEIRFSCKLEDSAVMKERVFSNMELALKYIPAVMVEMPVMPDREQEMRELLERLDALGIFGINLLELCFPYYNAEMFRSRGYELKYPPYRTLYNFWYAGGLPVAGSEPTALRLIRFAREKGMRLGIHYCSLENKNFGQMYQQNHILARGDRTMYFSPEDYYLRTVKAFGADAVQVRRIFDKVGNRNYIYSRENNFIQFHPRDAHLLTGRGTELAVSVCVMEERDGENVTRELKLLRAPGGVKDIEDIL